MNETFRSMFGDIDYSDALVKARESSNLRVEHIGGADGDLYLIEDISSIVLAERFKTWQEAVKRIAHEIKNPLTPIRLNLERLMRYAGREGIEPEKFSEITSLIIKELDRISELINQFKHLTPDRDIKFEESSALGGSEPATRNLLFNGCGDKG
ncbi:MAG: histidine kinase dimerization/phospho-acceptor domain-containing protein [Aquificota bacterium]|nr:histidine kinase dimerization/phospho-acceptor domain-containing protein [Aquificota bacterium]